MGDRNIDMDIDQQGQGRVPPDPRFNMGNNANHPPHSNMYPMLPVPGNANGMDLRHFPNNRDGSVFYGNQVNGPQHHNPISSINLGASSSFHHPGMVPPSGGIVIGMPRANSNQLPSVGHHGVVGVGVDGFGMNHHFMEGLRNSSKRKNGEMVPSIYQANGSASSSASSFGMPQLSNGQPQSMQQRESRPVLPEAPPVQPPPPPEYRVNGALPVAGGRSVRSRSNTLGLQMEPPVIHNVNHLVPGTYMGQPFQPTPWAEQQLVRTGNSGSTMIWNHAPAMPYLNGGSVNGGTINRNSTVTLNPPTHPHQHLAPPPPPPPHPLSHPLPHHLHPTPPGMQAMRVQNGFHLQPTPPLSFRQPVNPILPHGTTNRSIDDSEIRPRQPRAPTSYDLRLFRPHRSGMRLPFPVNDIWPHLRVLTADQVAILEGFVESSLDRHRDMRLDIDDMTYEELLALGERIGHVVTGVPEETLGSRLRTRAYVSSATESVTQESENCIVCLTEYQNGEMIGILECGHEYHVGCIKQWLQEKNVCPVCKLPGINVEGERRPRENPFAT